MNGDPSRRWTDFLNALRRESTTVAAFCAEASRIEPTGDKLRLFFSPAHLFHQQSLRKLENRRVVEEVARGFYGEELLLEALVDDRLGESAEGDPGAHEGGGRLNGLPSAERRAVELVIDFFDARLVRLDKES